MAAHSTCALAADRNAELKPVRIAAFSGLRVLTWRNDVLYASRGYVLLRATVKSLASPIEWEQVGKYRPAAWRSVTSSFNLASRFCRDGFHALATLPSGHRVGAVPHAIVTQEPGDAEFHVSHRLLRGTRPLHFSTNPTGHMFWGEYFDNPRRDEVYIYVSTDRGAHWDVAYTFPKGDIRHVHNIVYDEWEACFWVLTGDDGPECRILRASCDFKNVEVILSGNQQVRSAALVPTRVGVYFSSDTPLESNHVHLLDRRGNFRKLATLASSSTYGCRVGRAVFFSTMVEPSAINSTRDVGLYGSADGDHWQSLQQWKKDHWPMGLFQYGNVFLPDGNNTTNLLALTTIAVNRADLETSIWRM